MDIKKKLGIPIIKGVNVNNKLNLMQLTTDFEDICDILLLDAPSENLPGGNGKKFDWNILKDFKSKKKWMLAGGLNIENIEKAIKNLLISLNIKLPQIALPIRVALLGKKYSPSIYIILVLIGKNESLKRIKKAFCN